MKLLCVIKAHNHPFISKPTQPANHFMLPQSTLVRTRFHNITPNLRVPNTIYINFHISVGVVIVGQGYYILWPLQINQLVCDCTIKKRISFLSKSCKIWFHFLDSKMLEIYSLKISLAWRVMLSWACSWLSCIKLSLNCQFHPSIFSGLSPHDTVFYTM